MDIQNDYTLFALLSQFDLIETIVGGYGNRMISIYNTHFEYPHLNESFLDNCLKKWSMKYNFTQRDYEFDKNWVL